MFRLDNKIAVVTGGGSVIGKAVAKLLAKQGAVVHILDITNTHFENTIAEINGEGGKVFGHACDVSDQALVRTVFDKIGQLDILVNNAGIAHVGTAGNTSELDFDRVYKVNVKGVYNCLQSAVSKMEKKGGVIINMSSIAAHVGLTDRFAYSMSKGAIHAMTLSVARDYLHAGIRCNSISPARVHTPFVDGFISKNYPGKEEEIFKKLSASQPIGRMGTVEEIASVILYLSSDEAAFITGCDYPVDGGFIHLNT